MIYSVKCLDPWCEWNDLSSIPELEATFYGKISPPLKVRFKSGFILFGVCFVPSEDENGVGGFMWNGYLIDGSYIDAWGYDYSVFVRRDQRW